MALQIVEYFNYVGSVLTNDARCAREIKSTTGKTKAIFNKQIIFFPTTSKFDCNLRKKLVQCYIWSTALCGVRTWTLRKVDPKRLENF